MIPPGKGGITQLASCGDARRPIRPRCPRKTAPPGQSPATHVACDRPPGASICQSCTVGTIPDEGRIPQRSRFGRRISKPSSSAAAVARPAARFAAFVPAARRPGGTMFFMRKRPLDRRRRGRIAGLRAGLLNTATRFSGRLAERGPACRAAVGAGAPRVWGPHRLCRPARSGRPQIGCPATFLITHRRVAGVRAPEWPLPHSAATARSMLYGVSGGGPHRYAAARAATPSRVPGAGRRDGRCTLRAVAGRRGPQRARVRRAVC